MKKFEEYLSLKIVRKQKENPERAKSLIAEAEKKRAFMKKIIEKLSLRECEPNFIIENGYDVLIELIRALMLVGGYNSQNSHEAEVVFMDELRYFRNGIKYYGKILELEYAQKVLHFQDQIYPKLLQKCREKGLQ